MNDTSVKEVRKKFGILLTDDERKLLSLKATNYGYKNNLSEYIRSCCINETLIQEDITGKKELLSLLSENLSVFREIQKEIMNICKKITLSKEDIKYLKNQNEKIMISIDELKKIVVTTITINYNKKKS